MGAEPSSQNALPEDEHPVENQLETLLDIRPTDPDELYPKSVQEQEVKSPIKHCPRSLEHSIGPPMFSEPSRSKLVEQFVPLLETQPPSLGWNEGSPTSAKPSYLELVHLNESPDAVPSPLPDRRPEEVEFKKGDDRPEGTQFGSLQAVPQEPQTTIDSNPVTLSIEYEDGDVILRTDDTDFRVHTLILRQASPFFHSLFTLPQPPDSKATPIVPMEEDSKVLHTLIRLIYPVRYKLFIDNLPFATRLLRAAIKLQIECAIDPIRESTTQLLRKEPNPLRAWALAKHLGNKEAEEEAVLRYIKCDTPSLLRMRVAEMRSIDALDYFDLMKRREDALQEAETAIENTVWACSRCRGTPAWRRCYEDAIAGLNPFSGDVASDQLFELSAYRSGCTNCVDSIHDRNRRPVSVSPSDLRARLGEILLKYSP